MDKGVDDRRKWNRFAHGCLAKRCMNNAETARNRTRFFAGRWKSNLGAMAQPRDAGVHAYGSSMV